MEGNTIMAKAKRPAEVAVFLRKFEVEDRGEVVNNLLILGLRHYQHLTDGQAMLGQLRHATERVRRMPAPKVAPVVTIANADLSNWSRLTAAPGQGGNRSARRDFIPESAGQGGAHYKRTSSAPAQNREKSALGRFMDEKRQALRHDPTRDQTIIKEWRSSNRNRMGSNGTAATTYENPRERSTSSGRGSGSSPQSLNGRRRVPTPPPPTDLMSHADPYTGLKCPATLRVGAGVTPHRLEPGTDGSAHSTQRPSPIPEGEEAQPVANRCRSPTIEEKLAAIALTTTESVYHSSHQRSETSRTDLPAPQMIPVHSQQESEVTNTGTTVSGAQGGGLSALEFIALNDDDDDEEEPQGTSEHRQLTSQHLHNKTGASSVSSGGLSPELFTDFVEELQQVIRSSHGARLELWQLSDRLPNRQQLLHHPSFPALYLSQLTQYHCSHPLQSE